MHFSIHNALTFWPLLRTKMHIAMHQSLYYNFRRKLKLHTRGCWWPLSVCCFLLCNFWAVHDIKSDTRACYKINEKCTSPPVCPHLVISFFLHLVNGLLSLHHSSRQQWRSLRRTEKIFLFMLRKDHLTSGKKIKNHMRIDVENDHRTQKVKLINLYLNQRADKNIKARRAASVELQNGTSKFNYTRLDPLIKN